MSVAFVLGCVGLWCGLATEVTEAASTVLPSASPATAEPRHATGATAASTTPARTRTTPGAATKSSADGASFDAASERFSAAPEVGVVHSEFAGVPINAIDARLRLGALLPTLAASGYIGYSVGRTEWGLTTQAFFIGGSLAARLGRWQLGGSTRMGLIRIDRFTSGPALLGGFFGLEPLVSFDVALLPRDRAVYLTAAPAIDILEARVMGSAAVRLGLRW